MVAVAAPNPANSEPVSAAAAAPFESVADANMEGSDAGAEDKFEGGAEEPEAEAEAVVPRENPAVPGAEEAPKEREKLGVTAGLESTAAADWELEN